MGESHHDHAIQRGAPSRLLCPLPLRERAQWSAHELEWVRGCRGYPSPIIADGSTEQPSSARGEGAMTTTEIAAASKPAPRTRISRCQTATRVPAARFCARVLHLGFVPTESKGGRSADRRLFVIVVAPVSASVGRAVTRGSRRAKPRPTRSPFGAPPWRSPATPRSVFGSFPETPSTSGMRMFYYGRDS
jgi:hypothetical protein